MLDERVQTTERSSDVVYTCYRMWAVLPAASRFILPQLMSQKVREIVFLCHVR